MERLASVIRKRFSADKLRFSDGKFDLDLTYITDRIIAMGFPAEGVESAFRNSLDDVASMLMEYHGEHFMVFNLSGRSYDYSKLNSQVQSWGAFPDHHPPPLGMLFRLLLVMKRWLMAEPQNVASVHCMAGKGRTGTVIAAYFLYAGLFRSSIDALHYFATRRSSTINGVTYPGQRRYVGYVEAAAVRGELPSIKPIVIDTVTISSLPIAFMGGQTAVPPVLGLYVGSGVVYGSSTSSGPPPVIKRRVTPAGECFDVIYAVNRAVKGDITITADHQTYMAGVERLFRLHFHSGYVGAAVESGHHSSLVFCKDEVDLAHNDTRLPLSFAVHVALHGNVPYGEPVAVDAEALSANEEIRESLARRGEPDGTCCWTDLGGSVSAADKVAQARAECESWQRGNAGVEKSGWLVKEGHKVRSWKRRWFVLREGTLTYFKSPKDPSPCGEIHLEDICAVIAEAPTRKPGAGEPFELLVIRRCEEDPLGDDVEGMVRYSVCAPDERQKAEWVEAIEVARMELRGDVALGSAVLAPVMSPAGVALPLSPPPTAPAVSPIASMRSMGAV